MNPNSKFLSHLRLSSEAIKDWPAWKTEIWSTPQQEAQDIKKVDHAVLSALISQNIQHRRKEGSQK